MLLGAGAGSALGVARVGVASGNLVVAVDPGADQNSAHGVIVEPFVVAPRDGFRVRQDQAGRPTITTSDPDCFANPVVNDVVCDGGRASAGVTARGGADSVTLTGHPGQTLPGTPPACIEGAGTATLLDAEVDLGDGDDVLAVDDPCSPGFAPTGSVLWRVRADGGAGLDRLRGGSADDTLLGGADNNDLEGRAGDDLLRGGDQRDDIDGEAGDDTLRGGDGLDALNGGDGDDLLHGGLNGGGPDVFVGGTGTDTVTYSLAGSGVTVTIFDPSNATASEAPDGRAGENDFVQGDVENVTGSGNGDSLTGNDLANRIDGSLGADAIAGAAGLDTLLGGEGNDAINARGADRDPLIDCGPGAADSATVDLVDRLRRGSPVNCETVIAFASDDGPPARLTGRVLRPDAAGVARARLACPRNARVTCRGALTLRRVSAPGRVLRRARYAVARGRRGAVAIRVPASLRRRRALLQTVERGVSRKGPRGVARIVRIA